MLPGKGITKIVRLYPKTAIVVLLLVFLAPFVGDAAELREGGGEIDQHALFRVVGFMYGLDPELLEAVAEVESAGRSDAVSPKGAIGLMQLMPATATRYRVRDPRDPVENALGAARYLAHLRDATALSGSETGYDLSRILAAYNAGEGAVWRYNGLPPYAETQDYVGRVLWVYLLGISPPPHAREHKTVSTSVKAAHPARHGDSAVLDELDALRQARASAAASGAQSQQPPIGGVGSMQP